MTGEELRALPTAEKLRIMETLWNDLRERSDSAPVSQEVQDLLDARRARFRSGVSRLHDWDAVKGQLGRS
jgi:putative addiction module component (TIGR02574 family)